jgi:hypothetical protein
MERAGIWGIRRIVVKKEEEEKGCWLSMLIIHSIGGRGKRGWEE